MENFQDMDVLVSNCVEIPVENQDMEIFKDVGIFKDLEDQNHTQCILVVEKSGATQRIMLGIRSYGVGCILEYMYYIMYLKVLREVYKNTILS